MEREPDRWIARPGELLDAPLAEAAVRHGQVVHDDERDDHSPRLSIQESFPYASVALPHPRHLPTDDLLLIDTGARPADCGRMTRSPDSVLSIDHRAPPVTICQMGVSEMVKLPLLLLVPCSPASDGSGFTPDRRGRRQYPDCFDSGIGSPFRTRTTVSCAPSIDGSRRVGEYDGVRGEPDDRLDAGSTGILPCMYPDPADRDGCTIRR